MANTPWELEWLAVVELDFEIMNNIDLTYGTIPIITSQCLARDAG